MRLVPQDSPETGARYHLADLGFADTLVENGWLASNPLSELMETYLDRLVGENAFQDYGTQFPVSVKTMDVNARTPLRVNVPDDIARQRYDAFGKTALWYVEATGPDARLYMGFKRPVSAEEFYRACMTGKVEPLLHSVTPRVGECYLVRPGLVHAAKDVTLLEIAESSELWFRLYDWGKTDRELHLEEAFDLIDLKGKIAGHAAGTDATEQFTVNAIPLTDALKSHRDEDDTFLLYVCVKGAAVVQADGTNYGLKTGEVVLVPAEVSDFFLLPAEKDTMLLEVRMDPRSENDIVSAPVEE